MKRVMMVIILLTLLAAATLISHPTPALLQSYRSATVEETVGNYEAGHVQEFQDSISESSKESFTEPFTESSCEEFSATTVITITMTPVRR